MARQLTDAEIKTAENIFRGYLRGNGLKFTPERKTLLHEVLKTDQHFEAEEILVSLRQSGSRVAKATIYRTLPLLVNSGIIKPAHFGEKHAHYEHTFGQAPHDHMVCRQCERIIEFDSQEVGRLRTEIAAQHSFHAVSHRFQITGLCQQCADNGGADERPKG
jgi:Fur family ferric uptake transcriptional regulator